MRGDRARLVSNPAICYCLSYEANGQPLGRWMRTINTLNPFPHGKILDQTKLKATADDKCNKNDKFCL